MRGSILKQIPAGDRQVALTFDDGPGPFTAGVLDVLAQHGVRATFFVCGRSVEQYPGELERVLEAGHLVANHSYSHPQAVKGSVPFGHFDQLAVPEQVDQLDRTTDLIMAAGAVAPRFFRGPGGQHLSPILHRVTQERGMIVTDWSADTLDWSQPPVVQEDWVRGITHRATVEATQNAACPIVLMHDAKASAEPESDVSAFRGNTLAALPGIITYYLERDYEFVAPDGADPAAETLKGGGSDGSDHL